MVQRTLIRPPSARIGPVTPEERKATIEKSPLYGKYEEALDRESAYEMLQKRTSEQAADENSWGNILMGGGKGKRQGVGEAFAKSLGRSIASGIGNAIIRTVLGGRR
jgi:hypothetical protein